MLERLEALPPDPILGLSVAFSEDPNPSKVDLGVGVYKDEHGRTPVMSAVKKAEQHRLTQEDTKAYLGQAGVDSFIAGVEELLFGSGHPALAGDRIRTLQAPGGCGALRVAAEILVRANPSAVIWASDPTWPNHHPLLGSAGIEIKSYPYYDRDTHGVNFSGMLDQLGQAAANDIVLLHGCCHNPCGADLSQDQWRELTALVVEKRLLPFIDIAYQGLGNGLEPDAFGVRHLAEHCPELFVASSCSKNFGLYRDRVGALSILTESADNSLSVRTHGASIARSIYSTAPAHGGMIVGDILSSDDLRAEWLSELTEVRERINGMRKALSDALREATNTERFDFITHHRGMFSFLGIDKDQVSRLRDEFSIYAVGSSRINVAGLTSDNVQYVANAIAKVL